MDCPRCKLMLQTTDYEGIPVELCDNCWGIWLDQGELKQVIDTRDMKFSAEERRQLTDLRAQSAQEENNDPAACPHCGKIMTQVHADAGIHLVIDRCPEHGVWLDTGEIKAVQAVAEKSAQLHRLLIAKLGLLPS